MPTIVQEIIDPIGMETFAKEPKVAKLLRVLKPTLVSRNQKTARFSHMTVIAKLMCFGSFTAG